MVTAFAIVMTTLVGFGDSQLRTTRLPHYQAVSVIAGADRDAFLPLDEICFRNLPTAPPPPSDENGKRRRRIRDVLKPGEEVLVQIAKEQFANNITSWRYHLYCLVMHRQHRIQIGSIQGASPPYCQCQAALR